MLHSKKLDQHPNKPQISQKLIMDFITIGVSCNCLVVLFESGALGDLLSKSCLSNEEIGKYGDRSCITSALITLVKCGVIERNNDDFSITEFGRALSEYIGLITIFFDGYASLVANQVKISRNETKDRPKLINGASVSKASTLISEKMVEPALLREVAELKLAGTFCDLGCGYATMLSKICEATKNPGLGFDNVRKVVREARRKLKNTNINIEFANISNLEGVWEDVVSVMQCHVFHDFTPNQKCIEIMDSYLTTFPNMKCFLYIDTVSPSVACNDIFPGFDYVHGLLGIPTRTYEETLAVFSKSKYKLVKEVSLDLPNTFLWILSPLRNKPLVLNEY